MAEPKNLESFYVPLTLATWISRDLRDDLNTVRAESTTLAAALQTISRITLVGDPGAGKTTATSHYLAALADRKVKIQKQPFLPVYIQLRNVKSALLQRDDLTIRSLMIDSLRQYGFTAPDTLLDRKLASGQCVVVLDGFDELADKTGKTQLSLAQKVKAFTAGVHPQNRIVVTSRPYSYEPAWFTGFQVLEVRELTSEQIDIFVLGWFPKKHTKVLTR